MRKTLKGLYEFWSGFGIPAYPEYAVPDDAQLPYITYETKEPAWRDTALYTVRVWYRDTSFEAISRKVDEISNAIGEGCTFALENGFIWLFKDELFMQMQPTDEDDLLKVAYLSMIIHVLA